MSVRVRETCGTSWPDQRHPGTRHWRSTSVSYGLFTWLAGLGAWAVIVFPFALLWWLLLAEVWIGAEALLILVTGVLAAVAVAGDAKLSDVTFTRLRFGLFMVNVRGRS